MCAYAYTHIHIYMYTYILIYLYTHIYTYHLDWPCEQRAAKDAAAAEPVAACSPAKEEHQTYQNNELSICLCSRWQYWTILDKLFVWTMLDCQWKQELRTTNLSKQLVNLLMLMWIHPALIAQPCAFRTRRGSVRFDLVCFRVRFRPIPEFKAVRFGSAGSVRCLTPSCNDARACTLRYRDRDRDRLCRRASTKNILRSCIKCN